MSSKSPKNTKQKVEPKKTVETENHTPGDPVDEQPQMISAEALNDIVTQRMGPLLTEIQNLKKDLEARSKEAEEEVTAIVKDVAEYDEYSFSTDPKKPMEINAREDTLDEPVNFYMAGGHFDLIAYEAKNGMSVYPPFYRISDQGIESGKITFDIYYNRRGKDGKRKVLSVYKTSSKAEVEYIKNWKMFNFLVFDNEVDATNFGDSEVREEMIYLANSVKMMHGSDVVTQLKNRGEDIDKDMDKNKAALAKLMAMDNMQKTINQLFPALSKKHNKYVEVVPEQ